jgi:sodium/pantothenate symporter
MTTGALIGLFWRRATREAIIASTIVGVALLVCGFFYPPLFLGVHPVVLPLFVSLVVFFIVSLVTPRRAVYEDFFKKLEA